MTDIRVYQQGVPKIPRNKRIYSDYRSERVSIGTPETVVQPQRNIQAKVLSYDNGDFASRTIDIIFDTPFLQVPEGYAKVYRYDARSGGGFSYTNAVHYYDTADWKTNVGFKLIIEDYEDLNGLFLEFNFTEVNDEEN